MGSVTQTEGRDPRQANELGNATHKRTDQHDLSHEHSTFLFARRKTHD